MVIEAARANAATSFLSERAIVARARLMGGQRSPSSEFLESISTARHRLKMTYKTYMQYQCIYIYITITNVLSVSRIWAGGTGGTEAWQFRALKVLRQEL